MPTLKQIAKLAGVSICAVSRALRDDPKISAATRARVHAIADEYHYRPNRPARSVFTGKTATVGCIVPTITDPFTSFLLKGFIREVYAQEYQVFIQETYYQPSRFQYIVHAMMEHRVDGVFLFPGIGHAIPNELVTALLSHNVALASIESISEIPIDHVRFDRETFKRHIYQYLIQTGHRHVIALGTVHPDSLGPMGVILMLLEEQGFPAPRHFPEVNVTTTINFAPLLAELKQISPPYTLILTDNDQLGARLLNAAQQHGIAIPETYSLLACGSTTFPQLIFPTLSVIDADAVELGHQAAQLMFQRIGEESVVQSPARVVMVPPQLLIRASCRSIA